VSDWFCKKNENLSNYTKMYNKRATIYINKIKRRGKKNKEITKHIEIKRDSDFSRIWHMFCSISD